MGSKDKIGWKVLKYVPIIPKKSLLWTVIILQILFPGCGMMLASINKGKWKFFWVGLFQFLMGFFPLVFPVIFGPFGLVLFVIPGYGLIIIIGYIWSWIWAYLIYKNRKMAKSFLKKGKFGLKKLFK